jgi:SulP family sulfate permease
MFVRRVAHFVSVDRVVTEHAGVVIANYTVTGELFFASSNDLTTLFEYAKDPDRVVIDMSQSHIWDASTVAALDAITTKYEQRGKTVELLGMNRETSAFHTRLSGGLGTGH